jgi:hypothetical protein
MSQPTQVTQISLNGLFTVIDNGSVRVPAGPPHRVADIITHDACWAPDGRHLVFAKEKNLFIAKPDGSEVHKLAAADGYVDWMRFSPDGTRLRFNVFLSNGAQIFEMRADGSGLHRLFTHACCGAWSPDGKYYFYHTGNALDTARGVDYGHIWVLPERRSIWGAIELGSPFQLTAGPVSFWGATTPSADGKQLRQKRRAPSFLPTEESHQSARSDSAPARSDSQESFRLHRIDCDHRDALWPLARSASRGLVRPA